MEMAISNEQKIAAFDGIMRLVGTHALGEWFGAAAPPERLEQVLMISKVGDGRYGYYTGHYQNGIFHADDIEIENSTVICWKYDDAENIVKLLKF